MLLLLVILLKFGQHLFIDYQELQAQKYRMIAGFNIAFDAQQPDLLKSTEHRCKTVLYLYEIPLYLFLAHDAYDCGAVYYRALKGTPEEKTWVQENENIRHVVTFNPLVNFSTAREGGIWLLPGERLEFHSGNMKLIDHLELYFENRGSTVTLELEVQGEGISGQQYLQLHVPAEWSGWLASPLHEGFLVKMFAIDVQDVREMIFLKGVRIDPTSPLYWPWDQGIALDYTFQDKRDTVYFSSAGLNPFAGRDIYVIADSGSTIIAEISE
jgi:hypothetical protein